MDVSAAQGRGAVRLSGRSRSPRCMRLRSAWHTPGIEQSPPGVNRAIV